MSRIFDRFTESLKKKFVSEDELITSFLNRVALTPEENSALRGAQGYSNKREEELRVLLRKMYSAMRDAEITTEEVLRSYPFPVRAILLMRYLEKQGEERSTMLVERINEIGFKLIQNDVWVLPPARTPQTLESEQELKLWVYENLVKKVDRELQFVMPFVTVIDLKKTVAERRRIRKKYASSTIFNVMEVDQMVPPSFVYTFVKGRGLGIERVVRSGDLVFLSSSFSDDLLSSKLEDNKREVVERLAKTLQKETVTLDDISEMDEVKFAGLLEGLVPLSRGVAQRLIAEAKYWKRVLAGSP